MKKITNLLIIALLLSSCTSVGRFGAGVDITFDPRTIGMQIDDTIMQKNLSARLALTDKKYFLTIQSEARSVKNAITIKGETNFRSTAKDIFITSQLRSALVFNKKTKARNYTLETINKNIYIFGIAMDQEEKKEVINEANKIFDVKEIIPSIYLASELSRNKI